MKKIYLVAVAIMLLFWHCSEVKDWNDPKDNIAPGAITNPVIEGLNGGARITYTLPSDNDLLGVKAIYSFSESDEVREAFSSAFRDTIELFGFPDTNEYEVKLITLDKSRNESEPVDVTITPLTPPVDLIRESLKMNATFGGVYMAWENPNNEKIALSLYVKDSTDNFVLYDTYYSEATDGKYAFRGFENEPMDFKVDIRDRWLNYADPIEKTLTPLFEEEIVGKGPQGNIWTEYGYADRTVLYRGDISTMNSRASRQFPSIFDGKTYNWDSWWHNDPGSFMHHYIDDYPDETTYTWPMYFTIDMGKLASYSRLRYWMRDRNPPFSALTMVDFEVWGTNNPKDISEIGDGSKADNLKYWTAWPQAGGTDEWKNDWVRICDAYLELPSGSTDPSQLTNEDVQFIKDGFEFEIDPAYADQPFRYLRFAVYKNNAPASQVQLAELKFWGAYAE